ncbi:hypothetical protein IV88_GL001177 [Pediococcus argentinicus]|uniref:Uncharacterized protein n=2 Tax=Pediococcus argentinicus TaxID=480391 RepID=A0A0R2N8T8_9LACO|nr:hypothetical protein IV88_GL001177 [Pediococcus argentinicus]
MVESDNKSDEQPTVTVQPQQTVQQPQQQTTSDNMVTATATTNKPKNLTAIIIAIVVVAVVLIGGLGVFGYQNYKRNHQTQQQVADLGYTKATKVFGKNIEVYYNKSVNRFDIIGKDGSALDTDVRAAIGDEEPYSTIYKYKDKLKEFNESLKSKMPDKSKDDFETTIVNPVDHTRAIYTVRDGNLVYNFERDGF